MYDSGFKLAGNQGTRNIRAYNGSKVCKMIGGEEHIIVERDKGNTIRLYRQPGHGWRQRE